MRSKVTVVLLFLNVALFFYISQYEKVVLPDANGRRVLGPEVATIDALVRTSSNPAIAAVKLEKRGETWWLARPYEWPANPNAVDRLIKELQFLDHETSFAVADLAKSGQSLADYGLDQPALTLTFTSAKRDYTLRIGNATEIGKRLYLLSPDGTRIHVVGRSLADTVGMPLDELRSDSIFTIPVFEVRSLNLQTAAPNLKVRLRRDAAGRWGFETPINARASKAAVVVTINSLNALTAQKFLDPRDTDLDRTGLTSPFLRITLEGNARRETLLLGNATGVVTHDAAGAKTEYYAKIEDKAVVFTTLVANKLVDTLRTAQEQPLADRPGGGLRDPRVLDFEPGTVTAITIAAPGQPELSLQRLEGGPGVTWQVVARIPGQAPQTATADTTVVDGLLQKLHQLSARKFLSDAPSAADLEKYGFNRPEREITLGLSTGGGPRGDEPSSLVLQVGQTPGQREAFARMASAPFVYQILPDILAETPPAARHYRQRLLRDLPEGARITALTLTDLATNTPLYHRQLAATDKDWAAALAPEPAARRQALVALLGELHTLKAQDFFADAFSPERADTAQGPMPWKYRLDADLAFPGGTGSAQTTTSTLYLTDRLGGTTLLAGTTEFGGIEFEVTQPMLDALFALTYAEQHDPGIPAVNPAGPVSPAAAAPPPATPPATEPPAKP